ncbi:MAG TPA: hypothetical protein GXX14_04230 [Clostridiaceae bacterium]|nr:hypothetical protein [Clostridiaceae bacterium]
MELKKYNNENETNEFLQKLPIILSLVMTIIIGIISYASRSDMNQTYIRMAASLIVFYIIGMFIKNVLKGIEEEINEKKRQQEDNANKKENESGKTENKIEYNSKIDYKVGEFNEEFTPLKVSEVIKTSINDDKKK